ncbi:hypothetical protein MWU58_13310 [Flavobacteriaceae bacterium S0825]|uniref:hypothetical protein n=1 Tax=Gaetbulibacter sp. S0825 TaxID=2720084 RepID=UPI00143014C8|nr:hypothetical protein [Gaetbulibacter sp. S0825]MCK0110274.1 hypothetical protein [Flavobacteriaceae bacterium S0825]NIX65903.1 hypothetical protein [Gaetbulibacter sp. S0825]
MKKTILIFLIAFSSITICNAQEWFTSFDVAKRLALVQDKMLLVMWQNTLDYPYPVRLVGEKSVSVVVDLNENDEVNSLIWKHFVPLILLETEYDKLYNEAKKNRSTWYLDKLKDDSIKIMDANGNILNIEPYDVPIENLTLLIKKYALSTTFLKHELNNYSKEQNVTTAFNLGSKYLDFSIYVQKNVRPEVIKLADIYFDEAKQYLDKSSLNNKVGFLQRLDFLDIEKALILNNPGKARRLLKRIDEAEIDSTNQTLYNFLNYTTFKLLKKEDDAALFKDKLSAVDLKKTELIVNSNR